MEKKAKNVEKEKEAVAIVDTTSSPEVKEKPAAATEIPQPALKRQLPVRCKSKNPADKHRIWMH